MSDPLSEIEGCDLLARLFRARGYTLQRNVRFREYGVEFDIDGWDPKARVGFEFLSSEDDDHDDLSLVEYQALMDEARRGGLSLFVIDEVEPISAADLEEKANEFLDAVSAARSSRRPRKPAATPAHTTRPHGATKPAGKKPLKPARGSTTKKVAKKVAKKAAKRRR